MLVVTLLFISVINGNVSAQSEPDYPQSLGRCLGVYKIRLNMIPKEFSEFEYFHLDKFANQDTDNPERDSENRVFIRGKVKLTDNTIFKLKKAFVRSINVNGDENYYKDIYFETEEADGLSYKFVGEFLAETSEEDGSFTDVMGTLAKYKDGKKIAESKLKFYEYAEL